MLCKTLHSTQLIITVTKNLSYYSDIYNKVGAQSEIYFYRNHTQYFLLKEIKVKKVRLSNWKYIWLGFQEQNGIF